MAISTHVSIITLNVNGLNASFSYIGWLIGLKKQNKTKQDPSTCCLQETHFKAKDTHRHKVTEKKKILNVNRNEKKAGVAILILDKVDF